MKTDRNILIAFLLNISFAVFEFFGGLYTGSMAIMSDAIHDLGDGISIGFAYFLERKSKGKPDELYTYGYGRYSVLGGFITALILLIGSATMIYKGIGRLFAPVEIDYRGMLLFAIVGVVVNFCGVFFTRRGESLNQRAVSLHMLEDVLGWLAVLVGALVIRFTGWEFIDPVISVGVSVFMAINAIRMLREAGDVFLEKTPRGISVEEVKEHIGNIPGVTEVHHVHIWSLDGQNHYLTVHLVIEGDPYEIKEQVRQEMGDHGIGHVTMETEGKTECNHRDCSSRELRSRHCHHCH